MVPGIGAAIAIQEVAFLIGGVVVGALECSGDGERDLGDHPGLEDPLGPHQGDPVVLEEEAGGQEVPRQDLPVDGGHLFQPAEGRQANLGIGPVLRHRRPLSSRQSGESSPPGGTARIRPHGNLLRTLL